MARSLGFTVDRSCVTNLNGNNPAFRFRTSSRGNPAAVLPMHADCNQVCEKFPKLCTRTYG